MSGDSLKEASEKIKIMQDSLPVKIYPEMVSIEAKIPFKVLTLRELSIHRFVDLSDTACQLYSNNKVISAVIVTRALMETVALLYYLYDKVTSAIERKSLKRFDETVIKMLMGIRSKGPDGEEFEVKPIHIMEINRAINKWFDNFLEMYDKLSDISHPNWPGSFGYYGKVNEEEMEILFGENRRGTEAPFAIGVAALAISVDIFIHFYDRLAEILPEFTKLCEAELREKSEEKS